MNESADIRGTIQAIAPKLEQLRGEIGKKIFGQQQLIDELLLALLCRSHCILTGVPGLAKTLLIKTLAEASELQFTRVQFTHNAAHHCDHTAAGHLEHHIAVVGVLVDDVLHGALDLFQLLLCHALTSCQITQS